LTYTVPKLEDFSPATLDKAVQELLSAVRQEAEAIAGENDWKLFRDRWMARKNGILTQVNDLWLKAAPGPAKRDVGARVNQLKTEVEQTVDSAQQLISGHVSQARLEAERVDVTLPGIDRPLGAEHPMLKTMNEVVNVFRAMGYSVAEGPEIETDYYNFEALNFPPNHPARDTQDTLFVAAGDATLLRTHTSPVQVRVMRTTKPPLRIVVPGTVYRRDELDPTHSPMFHQVEGFMVDEHVTFADLKGVLVHFLRRLFGPDTRVRFRASFFPFTEPSAEIDIGCAACGRAEPTCRVCHGQGWLEILGAGMIHPNVLRACGYDPDTVRGFAFGMGTDRIAILRWGLDDLRLFYENDVRFLSQFPF
jgi:phenylalanyl-tRNA synthetase alpha chain